ncbi:MAG: hypothetical protein ACLTHV_06220 [Parasutterella excrementihominis]
MTTGTLDPTLASQATRRKEKVGVDNQDKHSFGLNYGIGGEITAG